MPRTLTIRNRRHRTGTARRPARSPFTALVQKRSHESTSRSNATLKIAITTERRKSPCGDAWLGR